MAEITAKMIIKESEQELTNQFERIDEIALFNQEKVLNAFKNNKIQARHFNGSTGYGYGDDARDTLGKVFADIFKAESALVSPLISSGTHALSLMLFAVCKAGDKILSVTGEPYDTLMDVIQGENCGSLKDYGVSFEAIDLDIDENRDPHFRYDEIKKKIEKENITAIFMQRSRGYCWKQPLTISNIKDICDYVKSLKKDIIIIVDNCYGEFVNEKEPIEVGATLCAGSLIKNPGGGIAPTGGYVVGRADLVERAAQRLTCPGVGSEIGSYISTYLPFYQGLFLAPITVKNALKGSLLFARAYSKLGLETLPKQGYEPNDIVTSIKFNNKDKLIAFCRSIQEISPIDSNVTLEPWDMPGYQDQVIMAAGTFIGGASIELSADSPIREPFIAYVQGGLTYEHVKLAVEYSLNKILK